MAGCLDRHGPQPTTQDVARAVRALVIANNAPPGMAPTIPGGPPTLSRVQVNSVRNLGCNLAPDHKGYLCGTVIELVRPGQGEQKMTRLVRLVRTHNGWKATMQ
jgi:hypothetical protein